MNNNTINDMQTIMGNAEGTILSDRCCVPIYRHVPCFQANALRVKWAKGETGYVGFCEVLEKVPFRLLRSI